MALDEGGIEEVGWGWCWYPAHERHYPCCIACKTIVTDMHLDGKFHRENTRSIPQRMDFPGREMFCIEGVQFRELGADGSPGALITTQWLHADHPLPVGFGHGAQAPRRIR